MHPVVRTILQSGDGRTYLYNAGDECTALTGGWVQGYKSGTNGFTKNASNITMYDASGSADEIAIVTNNLIDLSEASTLNVEFDGFGSGTYTSRYLYLVESTNKTANRDTYDGKMSWSYNSIGTVSHYIGSMDVSALNGLYYVRIHCRTALATDRCDLTVYNVWTE
jgi:hypothetical protein